jgi:hypothetical protein
MAIDRLQSDRLVLEPLRVEHADELAPVLDDPALHEFIGGRPATLDELRRRFARQVKGRSPDGRDEWLNWTVRVRVTGGARHGCGRRESTGWAPIFIRPTAPRWPSRARSA